MCAAPWLLDSVPIPCSCIHSCCDKFLLFTNDSLACPLPHNVFSHNQLLENPALDEFTSPSAPSE